MIMDFDRAELYDIEDEEDLRALLFIDWRCHEVAFPNGRWKIPEGVEAEIEE
jgi:hypothetical protein